MHGATVKYIKVYIFSLFCMKHLMHGQFTVNKYSLYNKILIKLAHAATVSSSHIIIYRLKKRIQVYFDNAF